LNIATIAYITGATRNYGSGDKRTKEPTKKKTPPKLQPKTYADDMVEVKKKPSH